MTVTYVNTAWGWSTRSWSRVLHILCGWDYRCNECVWMVPGTYTTEED